MTQNSHQEGYLLKRYWVSDRQFDNIQLTAEVLNPICQSGVFFFYCSIADLLNVEHVKMTGWKREVLYWQRGGEREKQRAVSHSVLLHCNMGGRPKWTHTHVYTHVHARPRTLALTHSHTRARVQSSRSRSSGSSRWGASTSQLCHFSVSCSGRSALTFYEALCRNQQLVMAAGLSLLFTLHTLPPSPPLLPTAFKILSLLINII